MEHQVVVHPPVVLDVLTVVLPDLEPGVKVIAARRVRILAVMEPATRVQEKIVRAAAPIVQIQMRGNPAAPVAEPMIPAGSVPPICQVKHARLQVKTTAMFLGQD